MTYTEISKVLIKKAKEEYQNGYHTGYAAGTKDFAVLVKELFPEEDVTTRQSIDNLLKNITGISVDKTPSFFTSITTFFMHYLSIPQEFYNQEGVLTKKGAQTCARYLISNGVFDDKNDMKTEALRDYNLFLPNWVFEYEKE